jgi:hypothetical protein
MELSALSLANGLRRTLVYPHKSQWPPDPQVLDSLKKDLPADIRIVIERQYQGVNENHDRVRDLRDSTRAT